MKLGMLYTQAERERISQVQVKLIKADEVERGRVRERINQPSENPTTSTPTTTALTTLSST
jgi:hypothetical protein